MDHYTFDDQSFDDSSFADQLDGLSDLESVDPSPSSDESIVQPEDFNNNQDFLNQDVSYLDYADGNSLDPSSSPEGLYDQAIEALDPSSLGQGDYTQDLSSGDDANLAGQPDDYSNLESVNPSMSLDESTAYQGDFNQNSGYCDPDTNYLGSYSTDSHLSSEANYYQDNEAIHVSSYEENYSQEIAYNDPHSSNHVLADSYSGNHQRSGSDLASDYLNDAMEQEGYASDHRNSYEDFSQTADQYRAEGKDDLADKYDDKAHTEQEWVEKYEANAHDDRNKAEDARHS